MVGVLHIVLGWGHPILGLGSARLKSMWWKQYMRQHWHFLQACSCSPYYSPVERHTLGQHPCQQKCKESLGAICLRTEIAMFTSFPTSLWHSEVLRSCRPYLTPSPSDGCHPTRSQRWHTPGCHRSGTHCAFPWSQLFDGLSHPKHGTMIFKTVYVCRPTCMSGRRFYFLLSSSLHNYDISYVWKIRLTWSFGVLWNHSAPPQLSTSRYTMQSWFPLLLLNMISDDSATVLGRNVR